MSEDENGKEKIATKNHQAILTTGQLGGCYDVKDVNSGLHFNVQSVYVVHLHNVCALT